MVRTGTRGEARPAAPVIWLLALVGAIASSTAVGGLLLVAKVAELESDVELLSRGLSDALARSSSSHVDRVRPRAVGD